MEKPVLIEDLGMICAKTNTANKQRYGIFQCPYCDNTFKTQVSHVNNFTTKSCGCLAKKITKERQTTHGLSKTKLYPIYNSIKNRCYNKDNIGYQYYGCRGITMCDEWKNDFMSFYTWAINNGYEDGLTIDRRNNDLGYCAENCWWTTDSKNSQNTRLIKSTNTSGYRCVYRYKNKGNYFNKWYVSVMDKRLSNRISYFNTPKEAAVAYNNWVIEHKTHHPLNIIP